MSNIFVVPADTLIEAVAKKLKDEFPEVTAPINSQFWKTAFFKDLAPLDSENFWYIRCASILRKVKKNGPIGVNKLRKLYGGRNRKGPSKHHSARGAGKIIRVALQQLESSNLVVKADKKGRVVTPEGISFLERTAHSVMRK